MHRPDITPPEITTGEPTAAELAGVTAHRDRVGTPDLDARLERLLGFGVLAVMVFVGPESHDRFDLSSADTGTRSVRLVSYHEKKINVIKALRLLRSELGLKEAKDIVESSEAGPCIVAADAPPAEAERFAAALREAGATVEVVRGRGEPRAQHLYLGPESWRGRLAEVGHVAYMLAPEGSVGDDIEIRCPAMSTWPHRDDAGTHALIAGYTIRVLHEKHASIVVLQKHGDRMLNKSIRRMLERLLKSIPERMSEGDAQAAAYLTART